MARVLACSVLLAFPSCGIPPLRPPVVAPDVPPDFNLALSPRLIPQPSLYGAGGPEVIPLPALNGAAGPQMGPPLNPNGPAGPESLPPPAVMTANTFDTVACLGIFQFYNDPLLTGLISEATTSNRELLALNEEVQVASSEVLARRGAYLPGITYGARADIRKRSRYTPEGAVEEQIEFLPGRDFPEPVPDFLVGLTGLWRLDIWRELRNARDAAAQRYIAAQERRNYFVTELVADVAGNYYRLMALDKRMENLDQTIQLQQQSREISRAKKEAGRGTELAVQRFEAEVRRNLSEKLTVNQEIIETENRINFLVNRYPQPVPRAATGFFELTLPPLGIGVPAQLLANRPDIRQAERELAAAGLDVQVARARFFPTIDLSAGVGYEAFNTKYLFITPESLVYNAAADLVGPLINKRALQAEYLGANARQLQSLYDYQRVILNAFTEVVNRLSAVENFGRSVEIKKQQLQALEASVDNASKLFQNPRVEEQVDYLEVLLAQRDLRDARMVLIETRRQQLEAIVKTYQALGGGDPSNGAMWELPQPAPQPAPQPVP